MLQNFGDAMTSSEIDNLFKVLGFNSDPVEYEIFVKKFVKLMLRGNSV
eukprot:CAMPEP_0114005662 /NCGR_PEP_ID=MMETSP0372-20130328/3473_1 /TAXON_ID=340204 /ORGANISM="Lankesteria abbotti" /LENGTH=47 /assembly_acc=CAM_ASM_000359